MTHLVLLAMCLVFVELFCRLNIRSALDALLVASREATRVLAAADIPDEEKEVLARRGAWTLLKGTVALTARFAVIGIALLLIYLAAIRLPGIGRDAIDAAASSVTALLAYTAAAILYAWIRNVIRGRLQSP